MKAGSACATVKHFRGVRRGHNNQHSLHFSMTQNKGGKGAIFRVETPVKYLMKPGSACATVRHLRGVRSGHPEFKSILFWC